MTSSTSAANPPINAQAEVTTCMAQTRQPPTSSPPGLGGLLSNHVAGPAGGRVTRCELRCPISEPRISRRHQRPPSRRTALLSS